MTNLLPTLIGGDPSWFITTIKVDREDREDDSGLAEGWTVEEDDEGNVIYRHSETGTTTKLKPTREDEGTIFQQMIDERRAEKYKQANEERKRFSAIKSNHTKRKKEFEIPEKRRSALESSESSPGAYEMTSIAEGEGEPAAQQQVLQNVS